MPDRFGVPAQMFGQVPDDFYGLIGRVALVATLLEDRVLGLLWALDEEPQGTHAGLAATRLAPMIRQRAERHADASGGALVADIESALVQALAARARPQLVAAADHGEGTGMAVQAHLEGSGRRLEDRLDRDVRGQAATGPGRTRPDE